MMPWTSAWSPATLATIDVIGATVVSICSLPRLGPDRRSPALLALAGHWKWASLLIASAVLLSLAAFDAEADVFEELAADTDVPLGVPQLVVERTAINTPAATRPFLDTSGDVTAT